MNLEKKKEILNYIAKVKDPKDEIFNINIHQNWVKMTLSDKNRNPVTYTVFKFVLNDGRIVYNYTDGKGKIDYPLDNDLNEIIDYGKTDKWSRIKENSKIYLFIGFIVFILGFRFFGPTVINYFKKLNDPLRKSAIKHNDQLAILNNNFDEFLSQNKSVYVYTNDTTNFILEAYPNLDIYDNPYDIVKHYGYEFENFNTKKDSLGYKIYLQIKNEKSEIQHIKNIDEELNFTVFATHKYSKEEANIINQIIDKQGPSTLYDKKVDTTDIAKERTIVSLTELKKGKLNGLKMMLAPRIDPTEGKYTFYIMARNKNIKNKAILEENLSTIKKLFFKSENCNNCKLREIPLQKLNQ